MDPILRTCHKIVAFSWIIVVKKKISEHRDLFRDLFGNSFRAEEVALNRLGIL